MTVVAPGKGRPRRYLKKTKFSSPTQARSETSNHSVRATKAKRLVYLTVREAAELLRLSSITLGNWRKEGNGPPFRKFGRRVVYGRKDVLVWARTQKRISTSDQG